MTYSSDRLDRIEHNLEQITVVIGQLGTLIRASRDEITLLGDSLGQAIVEIKQSESESKRLITEAHQRIAESDRKISEAHTRIAESDRKIAEAHQEAAIATNLALQSQRQTQLAHEECQRIWEYLTHQHPNGRGGLSDES